MIRRYSNYQETALPWVRSCPAHWSLRRLKNLVTERVEKGYPDEPLLTASQSRGVIPKADYGSRTVEAQKDLHLLKLVEPGDYVISLRSFQGGIEFAHVRGIISPAYTVLKPEPGVLRGYYEHFFKSANFISSMTLFVTGIREGQNIDYIRLSRAYMPVPPPEEQEAIGKFIRYIDHRVNKLIKAKKRLIELLNEQKQAIIHEAVTKGLDPGVPMKDSGIEWLGETPEHWSIKPLGSLMVERNETNSPIRSENILSLGLATGVIPYSERTGGGNKAKADPSGYVVVHPGDLVINSMNVVVGSVGLSQYFGVVSPVYYILYPKNRSDKAEWFELVFQDPAFQKSLFGLGNGILYIESKSTGKLNTIRMRIPMRKLSRVEIPIPSPDEQLEIIDALRTKFKALNLTMSKTQSEIDLIREYRTRLVSDVVTGQVDVNGLNLPDIAEIIDKSDSEEVQFADQSEDFEEQEEVEEVEN